MVFAPKDYPQPVALALDIRPRFLPLDTRPAEIYEAILGIENKIINQGESFNLGHFREMLIAAKPLVESEWHKLSQKIPLVEVGDSERMDEFKATQRVGSWLGGGSRGFLF